MCVAEASPNKFYGNYPVTLAVNAGSERDRERARVREREGGKETWGFTSTETIKAYKERGRRGVGNF